MTFLALVVRDPACGVVMSGMGNRESQSGADRSRALRYALKVRAKTHRGQEPTE
jgi:hypothetical protein